MTSTFNDLTKKIQKKHKTENPIEISESHGGWKNHQVDCNWFFFYIPIRQTT